MIKYYYDIRCSECGRFCRPVDAGVPYGPGKLEPPEEEFFCQDCFNKKIEHPEKVIIGCWWIRPQYVKIAKSILRHRRNIL